MYRKGKVALVSYAVLLRIGLRQKNKLALTFRGRCFFVIFCLLLCFASVSDGAK